MDKFESDFIKNKYWDKNEFRDATEDAARRTEIRDDEKIPNTPHERIENYIDRFSEIVDSRDAARKERGLRAIERLVAKKYIVKPENISDDYIKSVLLGNEAEMLGYNRHALKSNPQIRQTVLSSLEQRLGQSLDDYNVPEEIRQSQEGAILKDQQDRMHQWLEELSNEGSSQVPLSFRYWAFAEMLKLGDYDPVATRYNKRTETTVANFPELDPQALALVFDEVVRKRTGQPSQITISEEGRQKEFEELLKHENFGNLYSFMQEHVRLLKFPQERMAVTTGEWRLFPKGSKAEELTTPLQGFQTKWCIAGEGYAASYLSHSDMYVYFSQDTDGHNTIPRACIVDNESQGITEVRGIVFTDTVSQHLDSYITPVVQEKLQTIPSGDKWQGRVEDMQRLSSLHVKHLQNEPLTKEDLRFLYEIDHNIQGTGNGKDPRIKEIRDTRDIKADLSLIFDVPAEQISTTKQEALSGNIKYHYGHLYLSGLTSAEGLKLPESVGGSLNLSGLDSAEGLKLPESVGGSLDLRGLTSAEGLNLPESVGGSLDLSGLTSAEGLTMPESVGGSLYLSGLSSAEGLTLPETVGRDLYLSGLTSAEGLTLPESVGGDLGLSGITSAEGLKLPESVGGSLNLSGLSSAEGLTLPESVGGILYLPGLTSAEGLTLPESVGGILVLSGLSSQEKQKLRERHPNLADKI